MQRETMVQRMADRREPWDMVIVGGGATGAGIAVDAASRGYEVALVERGDFGKGTSSRSTKLVHGGVRYLGQGNVSLVMEALKERGVLRSNAPHLVKDLAFVVPSYEWWESPFYGIGLKLYDLLSGKYDSARRDACRRTRRSSCCHDPHRRTARRGHLLRRPVRRQPPPDQPDAPRLSSRAPSSSTTPRCWRCRSTAKDW